MQATSGMILFLDPYGSWKIQTSSVKTVQWGCIVRTVAFWSAPVHLSQIKITTLTIINPKNGLCGTRFLTDSCQIIGYIPLCVYIYILIYLYSNNITIFLGRLACLALLLHDTTAQRQWDQDDHKEPHHDSADGTTPERSRIGFLTKKDPCSGSAENMD